MSPKGCSHLDSFKKVAKNKEQIRQIHGIFVVGTNDKSRKTRISNYFCKTCKNRGPFLHACFDCVYIGCIIHIRDHSKNKKHCLCMDLTYGQIHCNSCGDYVYDSEIDAMVKENKMQIGLFRKKLFDTTCWNPTEEERALLKHNTKKICITPESTLGLRGLFNIGNTCFMNCIVQALIHTPLLRDYFLTGHHKCKNKIGHCLMCELANVFQEFYKGATSPLALPKFLQLVWLHSTAHLAGYEQQDAQEFLMATLDILHRHCIETMPYTKLHKVNNNNISKRCICIIDQIFTGAQKSDVICQKCKWVSTTIEPISTFPLDVPMVLNGNGTPPSLNDLLEYYTRTELLGDGARCSNCQCEKHLTKQLTIKTLPIVICFQFKRFTQRVEKDKEKRREKISSVITFPEMIDMTPYVCSKSSWNFPQENRYTLFSVINHIGSIAGGHYIAYIRQQQNFWYECDDKEVTPANLDSVLNSEAYLLFYHKHVLNYD